ncbi:MAG: sulfurtransferase TusA family protein, partial [candidate division WOR-3 bacterium]
MVKKIDARGLACPQPVVVTKKALEEIETGVIEVLVDNKPASENVSRFAKNAGCDVMVSEEKGDFVIRITKGKSSKVSEEEMVCKPET